MATNTLIWPSLLDVAMRTDPDGNIAKVVEVLNQTNQILDDIPWMEGNLPTGHRSTLRTALPTPTWRRLNQGVLPTKSTTTQVTDACGMLEAYSEVDKKLADLSGNAAAFRFSEDKAQIEGMSEAFSTALFYGNEAVNPEQFTGFTPRYNDISNAQGNLISGIVATGGASTITDSSDNTSIWLIGWSPETIHGIYPKGSTAGLKVEDKGQVTVESASESSYGSGRFEAYRTHFQWDCGLVVRDWRYAVRIAIDAEDLVWGGATGPNLVDMMVRATELLPSLSNCRPVFYANRNAMTYLRSHILGKVSYNLTQETVAGKHVTMFDGIPVRRCDAILNTEAVTVA